MLVLVLALAVSLGLNTAVVRSGAADTSLLWLNPSSIVVEVGQNADLSLQLDAFTNVYGIDVRLSFDPAVLSIVDVDASEAGVQIAPGTCPAPDFVLTNLTDNTIGTIEYVVMQLLPTTACNGGHAATISVHCLQEGQSTLTFTDSMVVDPDGTVLSHATQAATVICSTFAADFTGTPTDGPAPLDVTFTNHSFGTYDTCLWNFGGLATSTSCATTVPHTFSQAGTYTVSLSVTNAGSGQTDVLTRTDYITVYAPAVVASFTGTPTSGIAPLTVHFTNLSTGDYTTVAWTFGDGGTSTAANPTHEYTDPGSYTVTLTVSGPGGTDMEEKAAYITVRYGVYLPLLLGND